MSLSTPEGWVLAVLADVAHWASGGTPSRANTKFFSGKIPWIKTGELGPQFIRSTEECISEDAVAASSAKIFPKGAVALAPLPTVQPGNDSGTGIELISGP